MPNGPCSQPKRHLKAIGQRYDRAVETGLSDVSFFFQDAPEFAEQVDVILDLNGVITASSAHAGLEADWTKALS